MTSMFAVCSLPVKGKYGPIDRRPVRLIAEETRGGQNLGASARALGRRPCCFSPDIRRRFVLTEADENGLAKQPVGRPGQERDLRDEFRLDPVHPRKNQR